MRIRKEGYYIVITDNNNVEVFNAHASKTFFVKNKSNEIDIFDDVEPNFTSSQLKVLDSELKDEFGNELQGGVINWLRENTGLISNNVRRKTGVINGANQEVTLRCPNAAGAIVTVSGAFTGTISSLGGTTSVEAPRSLWISAVGSKGNNKIFGSGSLLIQEYRIIAGGDRYTLRSSADFSGSVNIEIISSNSTHAVFGIGPFHTSKEEAIRDSRTYLGFSGTQAVDAGNVLAVKLFNPSTSGVNLFVYNRLFGNDLAAADTNLEYIAYSNPTIVLPNTSNGLNLRAGEPNSTAVFSYGVDTLANTIMGGTIESGEILPRGEVYSRDLTFVIPPNFALGFTIKGAGNNLVQAARISVILEFYEETTN
jgi:hypothetical protein